MSWIVVAKLLKSFISSIQKGDMYSSKHLNGNLLAVVDVETTGLNPQRHDIIQLCILPLGPDLRPSQEFSHFEIKIQPSSREIDPEIDKINAGLYQTALIHGLERWSAVDLLIEWFKKLRLPFRKAIVPLGCNFIFDRGFLTEFMGGPLSYGEVFRDDYRDVQKMALMINDLCDWHSERIPFPKTKLSYLCSCLGVEHINKHDATGDCLATGECYRRLMTYQNYWTPTPIPYSEIPVDGIDGLLIELESSSDKKKTLQRFLERTGR